MTFHAPHFVPPPFAAVTAAIRSTTAADVERALTRAGSGLEAEEFMALLSPAALPYLDTMREKARTVTRRWFPEEIELFAPLYLSNSCKSVCTYCSFSHRNDIERLTLTPPQAEREAKILASRGIRKAVILTGEDYAATSVPYLAECLRAMRPHFQSMRLESYPLREDEYALLREAGMEGVIVYQETYDPERYAAVHLRGMKKRYEYRLEALDRAARAGVRMLSLGALLGLSDPASDVFSVGLHGRHLQARYNWSSLIVSLPRVRPAVGLEEVPAVSDAAYAQYLYATRLFLPTARLVLTTREDAAFRRREAGVCINLMSAGVEIAPGGYSGSRATPQFTIADESSLPAVRRMIAAEGLRPVF